MYLHVMHMSCTCAAHLVYSVHIAGGHVERVLDSVQAGGWLEGGGGTCLTL